MNGISAIGVLFVLLMAGIVGVFMPWVDFLSTQVSGIDSDGAYCLLALGPLVVVCAVSLAKRSISVGRANAVTILGLFSVLLIKVIFEGVTEKLNVASGIPLQAASILGNGLWLTLGASLGIVLLGMVLLLQQRRAAVAPR